MSFLNKLNITENEEFIYKIRKNKRVLWIDSDLFINDYNKHHSTNFEKLEDIKDISILKYIYDLTATYSRNVMCIITFLNNHKWFRPEKWFFSNLSEFEKLLFSSYDIHEEEVLLYIKDKKDYIGWLIKKYN